MADLELTPSQIEDLALTDEIINDLATANPIARKATRNKIIGKFRDKLEDRARMADGDAGRKAMEEIPEILNAARKYIKDQIRTGGKDARGAQAAGAREDEREGEEAEASRRDERDQAGLGREEADREQGG